MSQDVASPTSKIVTFFTKKVVGPIPNATSKVKLLFLNIQTLSELGDPKHIFVELTELYNSFL